MPSFFKVSLLLILLSLAQSPSVKGYPLPYVQDGLSFSAFGGDVRCRDPILKPNMSDQRSWPPNFVKGSEAFSGGVFDGTSVWLVPMSADRVIRVDSKSKNMTSMSWPAGYFQRARAFGAGVFDGNFVWLIPINAYQLIRIRISTGVMEGFSSWPSGVTVGGNSAFAGAVFDGLGLWLVPCNVQQLIRVDPSTGNTTGFSAWPSGLVFRSDWFQGGAFDGSSVWLVPHCADMAVKVNVSTGNMTGYGNWPVGFSKEQYAFAGGVFDGAFLWFVPHHADRVVKINVTSGEMAGLRNWPAGFVKGGSAFVGGVFDGSYIWLVPFFADRVIRIDPFTGNMSGFKNWPTGYVYSNYWSFVGGTFDGSSVWLIPCLADRLIFIEACGRKVSLTKSLSHSDTETRFQTPSTSFPTGSSTATIEVGASTSTSTLSLTRVRRPIPFEKRELKTISSETVSSSYSLSQSALTATLSISNGHAVDQASTTVTPTGADWRQRFARANLSDTLLNAAKAVSIVVGSETLGKVVIAAGLAGATISGLVSSPATLSRAGRISSVSRALDCSFDETDSDPSYLDLPVQLVLGSGRLASYAGSAVASASTLLVLPFSVLLTVAVIGRNWAGNTNIPRHLQERVISNFCFMSLGYIGPTVLYALVLVGAHNGESIEIVAVVGSGLVVLALTGLLVVVLLRKFTFWFRVVGSQPSLSSVAGKVKSSWSDPPSGLRFENITPQSMLVESFGTLFDAARSAAPVVRSYFLEELLISILLQCLSGIRPSGSSCGTIAISMTVVSAAHLVYLLAVRPYADFLEFTFALLTALFVLALSVVALCLSYMETNAELRVAVGVLALLLSILFFVQPVVMGVVVLSRKHRQLLERQWKVKPPLGNTPPEQESILEVPLLQEEALKTVPDQNSVGNGTVEVNPLMKKSLVV